MEKFQDQFSQVLHANLDLLTTKCLEASTENAHARGEQLNAEGMRQIVEGLVNIIDEALEGTSSELLQTYLHTVVPGLVRRGRDAASLSYTGVSTSIYFAHVLERELPAHLRDDAIAWFAHFFARFTAAAVEAANNAQGR